MKETKYYSLNEQELFDKFNTDNHGLSTSEAENRIKKYGFRN